MPERKWCFIVLFEQKGERGFIPSVVYEDEPGHSPLIGQGELAEPWFWGETFEQAQQVCAKANADHGVDQDEADRIVASSIGATIRQEADRANAQERYDRIIGRE